MLLCRNLLFDKRLPLGLHNSPRCTSGAVIYERMLISSINASSSSLKLMFFTA